MRVGGFNLNRTDTTSDEESYSVFSNMSLVSRHKMFISLPPPLPPPSRNLQEDTSPWLTIAKTKVHGPFEVSGMSGLSIFS
jgi:hypothetical protein